ncbi:hypothetical protein [Radiobacillus sp. PE A8.2]|uniref:hypothetical protein n=1 Tax=Radiobacillus sp. PE A8.2 TaxID=3380349 RepID=UPI00388E9097
MYSSGVGFVGFFTAANDVNIVILIMLVFSLDFMINHLKQRNKSAFFYMVTTILIIVGLILIGSKASAIIGSFIILTYFVKTILKANKVDKIRIMLGSLGLLIIGAFLFTILFLEEATRAFERHSYLFQRDFLEDGSFWSFILTNRDGFLVASTNAFLESENIGVRLLFGVGKHQHSLDSGLAFGGTAPIIIEMDLFDIFFFSYGVIGSLLIYTYFLVNFYRVIKIKDIFKDNFRFLFSFFIFTCYSFWAGHVMVSATAGSYYALITCGLVALHQQYKVTKYKEKNSVRRVIV